MRRDSIATISLAGVAFTLFAVAVACELEFRRYPTLLAGLTPVQVPLAKGEVTRASFEAVWSEPHYLALVFPSDQDPEAASLLSQAASSVGSAKVDVIPFDFEWRAFEGASEVGRGSGRSRPIGAFGSGGHGLMFGEFLVHAGRTYDVEVRLGTSFERMAPMRPMIEVGVNKPGPSLGLPWVKSLSRPVAAILGACGLLFLGGAIWTIKKRTG